MTDIFNLDSCQLCDLDRNRAWFATTLDWCWCYECHICGIGHPVFVHKGHVPIFTDLEKAAIEVEAKRMFGDTATIRWTMDETKEHAHAHVIMEAVNG